MRTVWRSRVLGLGSLVPTLMVGGDALAIGHRGRAVYAEPTAYVVETAPTSGLVATDYLVPTVYAPYAPSYVAISYLLSPTYAYVAPTAYTRYAPTRYVRTAAVYPTVFETQSVSSDPCDPCSVTPPSCCGSYSSPSSYSGSVTMRQDRPRSSAAAPAAEQPAATRPTPSTVESVPAHEASEPAPAPAADAVAEPTMRRDTSPAPGRPSPGAAVDPNFPTPPEVPAHEKDPGPAAPPAPITSTPADAGGQEPAGTKNTPQPPAPKPPTPPVAPGGEGSPLDLPAPAAETPPPARHQVQKPGLPSTYLRSVGKGDLHKLVGKVISSETGRPEEGVRVTVANRGNTFVERIALSDASGRYSFTLPDGEWTVNVTMPSGRSYPVSQLNVSGGQINDELGRDIPSLTINR